MENGPEITKTKLKYNEHIKISDGENYFQFKQQCYKQTEELIIGAVYFQYMEHKQLYPILKKHQTIGYFMYVDGIFIIYNQNKTHIDETLAEFNKQTANIKFTIEKEQHSSIKFLGSNNTPKNNKNRIRNM
jgi:hypothetical protein